MKGVGWVIDIVVIASLTKLATLCAKPRLPLTYAHLQRRAIIHVRPRHLGCLLPCTKRKPHSCGCVVRVRHQKVGGHNVGVTCSMEAC